MVNMLGGTSVDRLVKDILSAFSLDHERADTRWRAIMRDLRRIVRADYVATVHQLHLQGRLPVRLFVREVQRAFPEFATRSIQFDEAFRGQIDEFGITLKMEPHANRALRGFYHRDRRGALIWLNLAHPPGAVAASVAHELGHWYRERLLGSHEGDTTTAFFNTDFNGHLRREGELFADLFPVLAAYPTGIAQRLFSRRNRRGGGRRLLPLNAETLARVRQYLKPTYGFDISQRRDLSPPHRLYYVTSMIHFARLRAAVLEEFDL